MKFTNYKNFMTATSGLIKDGWSLYRMDVDAREVTTIILHHDRLELTYILEHHKNPETLEESNLLQFTRRRPLSPLLYEREQTNPVVVIDQPPRTN